MFEGLQRRGVTPAARPGVPLYPQAKDPLTDLGVPGGASGEPDTHTTKNYHRGSENELIGTPNVGLELPANVYLK